MDKELIFGRIYFINAKCKITVNRKVIVKHLKGIVWTANESMYYDRLRELKKANISQQYVKLFDVEIIKDLGEPMAK